MTYLKRFLPVSLALSMTLLVSCSDTTESSSSSSSGGSSTPSTSTPSTTPSTSEDVTLDFDFGDINIGIVQLAEHPALDASTEGFIDTLVAAGLPEGNIEVQNAQGEQSNCSIIATKFVNDNVDLILAIATPAAQAVAGATTEIPILATAVTDFEVAGLTASNIAGVSDMGPIEAQIDLLLEFVPEASSIGILYCSSEDNSILQADVAAELLQERGVNPVVYTVAESSEIQQATQAAVSNVDGIYVPTDNLLAQTMPTVAMVANPAKVPVVVGESGMVDTGGLATIGVDYYGLGQMTAAQALDILVEGVDISTIGVEFSDETAWEGTYNQDTLDALGLELPALLAD